ncbi:hypothetical protein Dda3937_03572 [Dickeya dadantii 3937]|uniref:Uncharacterized protein n=1 Tax=Dickeya dadantii (strain 3937) TaxID=198628 RepID=E0SB91_DICD3|nr:hypothetical protein Dda3937_03572 [Dickeya dadantii 3937]
MKLLPARQPDRRFTLFFLKPAFAGFFVLGRRADKPRCACLSDIGRHNKPLSGNRCLDTIVWRTILALSGENSGSCRRMSLI